MNHGGLEEFRVIFRRLTLDDMQSWFGPVPTDETKVTLGFKDLQVVLETIAGRTVTPSQPVKEVPMGKIEANALSESVATLLKAGMAKAPLVKAFFDQWHDITLGERIAKSFRTKYEALRGEFSPNQIFAELEDWAGGGARGAPEHELAVLTVIAYFLNAVIYSRNLGVFRHDSAIQTPFARSGTAHRGGAYSAKS